MKNKDAIAEALEVLEELSSLAYSDASEPDFVIGGWVASIKQALTSAQDDEWQPIETAPKDGTVFLAIHTGKRFTGGKLTAYAVRWSRHHEKICTDHKETMFPQGYLTHWRPLPPPPNTTNE